MSLEGASIRLGSRGKATKASAFVITGSVHAIRGYARYTAYQAAKGALLALTRSLAADYAPTVRVNAILPGAVVTGLWDGIPEEDRYKADLNLSLEQQEALPARTGLHRSPVGIRWKEICDRGDEFYDWDCHSFHFMSGKALRADGSMTLYEAIEQEKYLVALADSLQKGAQPGLMKGLGNENPFKPRET